MSKRVNIERDLAQETLGGGEEGVVTSLMWQTDIMALLLNITTKDLNIEPLDIAFYHAVSREPSPRSGLDVDLVWITPTLTRHTVDFTPPDTRVACRLNIDIDWLRRKGGPRGHRGGCLHDRRKNLLGDFRRFLILGCF